ncbi:MAG TPA: Fur family transcriptional regulator [Candidatus Lustribacter sp.]|nr:Fur family transcriptional regulator [Candidatus Lustribacter sp.]
MAELGETLRAHGRRLTPQRRRIIGALAALEHATPDDVVGFVAQDGGSPVPASTVYRTLEALEELGIVSHTHLDHRSPSYHLAEHANHIHLVCLGCAQVESVPASSASTFVGNLRDRLGFEADVTHMAIHGWCAACRPNRPPE